ncbi:RILP-like protein-like [Papilio machaon]|uniref:RILP-like protein-like n=1 Tax=Papilio machaon TaxID=76193 RepID=A0A194R1J6_PAPMA|nr:RILP-like protein-like [Papilio machaon]
MAILDTLQLTNQVDKLAQVSRDLRRKHKQLQNQMRLVCEERTELTAIVQSQQRDIAALQQSDAQKTQKCTSCGAGFPEGGEEGDQSSRPTFSVRELRAILHERNELKLKLNRLEEQLQALQVEPQPDSTSSDTSSSVSTTVNEEEEAPVQGPLPAEPDDAPWKRNSGIRKFTSSDTSSSVSTTVNEEEEAPVQGPLPAEPDDAPWKRNSGIRKFFRKLFAESDLSVGAFSRPMSARGKAAPPPGPGPAPAPAAATA